MKKTVLVTGAHGFLGRYAARQFANAGYEVTGMGHGVWDRVEFSQCGMSFWHSADISIEALVTFAGEPDVIVHCAGSGSVAFSMINPLEDYARTVSSTAAVLEYIRLHSSRTVLVYPSSAAVYGVTQRLPIKESDVPQPASPYGVHKLLAENLCRSYADTFGIKVALIRFFSIYGNGLRKQLLWDACSKLTNGENTFFGTGAELRDWLHAEDAARLLMIAASHASSECPIVNGGSGKAIAVSEVLSLMLTVLGSNVPLIFNGNARAGDPPGQQADVSNVSAWGWCPRIKLEQGIQRYVRLVYALQFMIRVGFILEGYDWLGGVNYYRNLLSALALIRDPVVRPVMFVGTKTPEDIVENFYTAEIVRSSVLDLKSPAGFTRRVIRKFFSQRDLVLDALLRQHDIQVLSHYSGALSRRTSIKSIGWIPDFQYLHLPAYFTEDDRARREAAAERLISNCHSLIVSSVVAQDDLAKVSPASISKSNVLHFVPEVDLSPSEITRKDLEIRYKFKAPYFYLPNQFWIHKNHRIVIEALAKLKEEGITPMVLASGTTFDHRFPDHFTDLLALARREGVDVSFKVLGVIPYEDLLLLMRYSLAVINPSLFEGWSSTVEEAKALDKTVLLSSIPTHKEQSPNKGIYFDPLDAEDLARKMVGIMRDEEASLENAPRCSATYAEDRMNFALNYQEIVSCVFSENTLQGK